MSFRKQHSTESHLQPAIFGIVVAKFVDDAEPGNSVYGPADLIPRCFWNRRLLLDTSDKTFKSTDVREKIQPLTQLRSLSKQTQQGGSIGRSIFARAHVAEPLIEQTSGLLIQLLISFR